MGSWGCVAKELAQHKDCSGAATPPTHPLTHLMASCAGVPGVPARGAAGDQHWFGHRRLQCHRGSAHPELRTHGRGWQQGAVFRILGSPKSRTGSWRVLQASALHSVLALGPHRTAAMAVCELHLRLLLHWNSSSPTASKLLTLDSSCPYLTCRPLCMYMSWRATKSR